MLRRETWKQFDFLLFGAVIILSIFGVAMIRSAIAGNEVLAELVTRQVIYVFISFGLIIVLSLIDYRYWSSLARLLYGVAIFSLLMIYIFGTALFGSARWLDTGLILIQPSELAKIIMIIVLANFFAQTRERPRNFRWVISSFLLTFGVVLWILLQPNLSTSIVIIVIWLSMLWVSGLPVKYLWILAGVGTVFVILLLALLFSGAKIPFIQPYQLERIATFLFPDPNARHGNTYNVEQALVSIGSGGLFGQGYGNSTQVQLRFLKVRHTDFIFSAMASEFGFVGTVIVILLLVFVILRCFRAAALAADPFGALLAYGFGVLLFFQMAVNIGVNLNVIPVTGLTLPFISYGGSSMVSLAIGIGLVESVILRRKSFE
ncbi:bacterial cell division membrane protein [Anaerolinea thermolimosa]|uniref:FtsW/RodA/SpoVE family cell cycle protein n=1 Tax=Anaerolinea thermolimosa TaxID=229919 RepID=UPI0007814980|nr:FtsW/RodA/SpoVE family cell cycle protein [Anaerolinea thermolimosa]GAP06811.1 bacterial cell division membrane protein [Anaerolinea thermolimosa]